MNEQIIFIYCICHDLSASLGIKNDSQCKINAAEVMTVAIVSALFFGGNFSQARNLLKSHNYIRNMLIEGRLNRLMHEIDISIWQSIFHAIVRILEEVEQIRLIPDRKVNLTRQHSGCIRYLQSILRKKIETTFSMLVRLFPRKIHAVTKAGFLLKIVIFIVSFYLNQLL